MAVLQMQKICICALKKDRKGVLELLQAAGVMEITQEYFEDSGFKTEDTMTSKQGFDRNVQTAEQALEVLNEHAPEKTSLFSSLEGKKLAETEEFQHTVSDAEKHLETAKTILAQKRQLIELRAAVSRTEARIESLVPWMSLGVPLQFQETRRTRILVGALNSQMTLEQIWQAVAERAPEAEEAEIEIIGGDRDQTCITAVCLKEHADHLEDALRSIGFARPSQTTETPPEEFVRGLQAEIDELNRQAEAVEKQIAEYGSAREDLKLLADYYRIRSQKYAVLGQLPQSEKTFIVTGYVPEREVGKLEQKLESRFDLAFEASEVPEEETPPILLSNNVVAQTAEGIVASFGLPGRSEIDPSAIVSACYIFLFGLMLSDAAYGLLVFAGCFWALKRFPRMEENLKKSIRLFMYCGLSTLFWGVMFGGYFGDVVDVVSRTFFGTQITIPALWFVPLNDPMRMLLYSMIFGVVHMFLGMGVKAYMYLRDKKYMNFLVEVVFWSMMLIGLVLMLIPTSLFGSIVQVYVTFPPVINMLAKALAIIGAVGIFLMSARDNKNPVLRLALGAYDLYNITGWLSDVLSYSRLLALGLATGVIASVVNQMGSMFGSGIIGFILFAIVFVIGHVFNLAINLLGAYVHTCRLQYVEFFGKFYEGGGREFVPFKQSTKYVDIKED